MTTSEEKALRDAAPFTDHCRSSAPSRCAAPQMAKCSNAPTARDEPVTLLTARKFAFLQGADMTDEADSHSPDTFDTAAEEPDSLTGKQRTRALYHFLDRVDVIIKKRCELLRVQQSGSKSPGEQPLRQEMQAPKRFDRSITPRGDDELTDLSPVEASKR